MSTFERGCSEMDIMASAEWKLRSVSDDGWSRPSTSGLPAIAANSRPTLNVRDLEPLASAAHLTQEPGNGRGYFMASMKKCAHPACTCMTADKYCSSYCKDKRDSIEISCGCGHSGCSGHL